MGVDVNPLLFLPSVPFPSPVIAPPTFHPLHSLLLFPSPRKFSKEAVVCFPHCSEKMAARCKSWRGPNTPGPHDLGWLGSRVVSVLDSGAEGPGFKSQPRCLRQAAHTRCESVHQAAKLVATLLRIAGVTAGRAKSNGSRVYDSRHLQADCQEPGSAPEPYAR